MDYNYTAIEDRNIDDKNKKNLKIPSHLKEKMPKIKICPVPDDGKVNLLIFLDIY